MSSKGTRPLRAHQIAASLLATSLSCSAASAAETVNFPGTEITLKAVLHRPAGAGPFPAVVALHGCAGLYEKSGSLSPRHADWAERLAGKGLLVLFPDSFGSRGSESQCTTNDRVTSPSKERVEDAMAARSYLQSRSDVKADAISLLGWSNGGSTVLYAVQRQHRPRDSRPDFAKAVAFYPGCRAPAEHGSWHTRLPLMILIGAADDWTPPAPCQALADSAAAANEPVSITVYPGAYHDFDHPNLPLHTLDGLAFTASNNGRAHTGTNPAARQDALVRVPAFLMR
jgi:dienelactone hydrolase